MINCKTGSSRLLDVGLLQKSEESLLCKSCVVKQREKERKADESAMRKILKDLTAKKLSKYETQRRFEFFLSTSKKTTVVKRTNLLKNVRLDSRTRRMALLVMPNTRVGTTAQLLG